MDDGLANPVNFLLVSLGSSERFVGSFADVDDLRAVFGESHLGFREFRPSGDSKCVGMDLLRCASNEEAEKMMWSSSYLILFHLIIFGLVGSFRKCGFIVIFNEIVLGGAELWRGATRIPS